MLPVAYRINIAAPFPAQAVGANGIGVAKANGIYAIGNNYPSLVPIGSIPVPAQKSMLVYDTVTGIYNTVPLSAVPAFTGGYSFNIIAVGTGNYATAPNDDLIVVNKTVGSPTQITMVASATRGRGPVYIKDGKGDASTNPITVVFNGSEKADGLTSVTVHTPFGVVAMAPSPTGGWVILNFG